MLHMGDQPTLTNEITEEISKAITRLGGDPTAVDLADTWQVNRTLEFLGADIYVLTTVGSWRDTMSDEEVLRDLREWLRGGERALRPNPSFASVRNHKIVH
jgi:hypothetical protein